MKDDKLQEILELLPYSIRYSGEIEELLDYAKEQAERVKKLDFFLNIADEHLGRNNIQIMRLTDEIADLEYQKKRYREVIKKAKNTLSQVGVPLNEVRRTVLIHLRQALEELE